MNKNGVHFVGILLKVFRLKFKKRGYHMNYYLLVIDLLLCIANAAMAYSVYNDVKAGLTMLKPLIYFNALISLLCFFSVVHHIVRYI